jgi:hypothetical protein
MIDDKCTRGALVVNNEAHTIELYQTLLGAKPHIPIGRLRNSVDGILRKTVSRPPDVVGVLREGTDPPHEGTSQGIRGIKEEEKDEDNAMVTSHGRRLTYVNGPDEGMINQYATSSYHNRVSKARTC